MNVLQIYWDRRFTRRITENELPWASHLLRNFCRLYRYVHCVIKIERRTTTKTPERMRLEHTHSRKTKGIDPHVIYTNKSKYSGLNCINRFSVTRVHIGISCVHSHSYSGWMGYAVAGNANKWTLSSAIWYDTITFCCYSVADIFSV